MSITNDGSGILQEKINDGKSTVKLDSSETLVDFFEIKKISKLISLGKYERVGLQFPNHQLQFSASVVKLLRKGGKGVKFYLLGDNIQGSCCPDLVNCDHTNCDLLLKFGKESCLNRLYGSSGIRVVHSFGKENSEFDHKLCREEILKFAKLHDKSQTMVMFDLDYYRIVKEKMMCNVNSDKVVFAKVLDSRIDQIVKSEGQNEIPRSTTVRKMFGLEFSTSKDIKNLFYLGGNVKVLKCCQLVMELNADSFVHFDCEKNKIDKEKSKEVLVKGKRLLKKRYYLMNMVKCSKVFGIIMSSLTKKNYSEMVNYCKKLIKGSGKKYYVFYISKITPEKLANFTEIDIWVLINCCNNVIVDSNDYYKPVVTPYELFMGLNNKNWTGEFVNNFGTILEMTKKEKGPIHRVDAEFSFIKNAVISTQHEDDNINSILEKRDWKGMEDEKVEISTIEKGQDGIGEEYKLVE